MTTPRRSQRTTTSPTSRCLTRSVARIARDEYQHDGGQPCECGDPLQVSFAAVLGACRAVTGWAGRRITPTTIGANAVAATGTYTKEPKT